MNSHSQAGEDLALDSALHLLGIADRSYLDIGAYHPTVMSNTFLFYEKGYRGILVEPCPSQAQALIAGRPGDDVVCAALWGGPDDEVPYYGMSDDGWSGIDLAEAQRMTAVTHGRVTLRNTITTPALNAGDFVRRKYPAGSPVPTIVSIDAEGSTRAIVQSIDWQAFRPTILCVETLIAGTRTHDNDIGCMLRDHGYVVRGGSFVNTFFIARELMQ